MEESFNDEVMDETLRGGYSRTKEESMYTSEQRHNPGGKKDGKNFIKGLIVGFFIGLISSAVMFAVIVNMVLSGTIGPDSTKTVDVDPSTVVDNSEGLDMEKVEEKLSRLQDIVSEKYLFQADITKLEDGIYKGYMSGLEDPYSVYYTEEETRALMEETSGQYKGIGAIISKDPQTGIIKILKVFAGSPSEEAGLQAEDVIYKVGDVEVTGMDTEILIKEHIRGEEHTFVKMTVLRNGEEKEFDIERRAIEVPTVESKVLDGNVGYIAISQFDVVTSEQFKSAIDSMEEKGVSKLVIDLRNNPGGILDGTVEMLDYILPDGLLVYTADKEGMGQQYYSKDGHEINIPTSVLINDGSASASEVFAGAIKDFGRGTLVGTKSFGKGIVQNVIDLYDGTAVKITTQHYYTPSGFDLHGKGIEPDKTVELDEGAVIGSESDNQLKEAIELAR